MVMEKTTEEILIEEKEILFTNDMKESKERQRRIIAQCNSEIEYAQAQISIQEAKRVAAQKLLDELEARYPTEAE